MKRLFSRKGYYTPKIAKITTNPYILSEEDFQQKMCNHPDELSEGIDFLFSNSQKVLQKSLHNDLDPNLIKKFYSLNLDLFSNIQPISVYLQQVDIMIRILKTDPLYMANFNQMLDSKYDKLDSL